jgi:hypothetical protein
MKLIYLLIICFLFSCSIKKNNENNTSSDSVTTENNNIIKNNTIKALPCINDVRRCPKCDTPEDSSGYVCMCNEDACWLTCPCCGYKIKCLPADKCNNQ